MHGEQSVQEEEERIDYPSIENSFSSPSHFIKIVLFKDATANPFLLNPIL